MSPSHSNIHTQNFLLVLTISNVLGVTRDLNCHSNEYRARQVTQHKFYMMPCVGELSQFIGRGVTEFTQHSIHNSGRKTRHINFLHRPVRRRLVAFSASARRKSTGQYKLLRTYIWHQSLSLCVFWFEALRMVNVPPWMKNAVRPGAAIQWDTLAAPVQRLRTPAVT